ncbi:PAS domain-containing protein [Methanosarcina sp. UBA289]|uniref:PAS domain-containing protein n=1 Tax=Methanosarcina sp. UBA289 TaxID=1915574 RepID=UPI0025D81D4B|nr:PAS domain-containing protein [Methanosarcina sp. UBA289]
MISENAGPEELESIAVAVHSLVGLPTTIRSLNRKGLRLENGKILDRDYTGPILEEVLRIGKTIRGVPKEGTYLGRNVAVSPIFSEDGKVIAAIGIVDLLSILEMQEIIRTVVNNSHAVVFLWKNEEKWPSEFVSENVVQFGYTVEDFISGRVLYGDVIHPDDLKRVKDSLKERIRRGEVDFNIEYRIFTKAGDLHWVNERTFIQRSPDGEVTHLQGLVLDVTERKKSEEALRKSLETQKMLRTIINNSQAVAFLWENKENLPTVYVSENVTQFGYKVEDFTSGKIPYESTIHRDDIGSVIKTLKRNIEEKQDSFDVEYRIFTGDGKMLWVDEKTFIQRNEDGKATHFQGLVVDITERKEAQKMLEIQRELGTKLSTTWNFQTMLNLVLDACLQINGLDAGAIYLKDELLDQINLVASRGISPEFRENISRYKADSLEAKQIQIGKPIYSLEFYSDEMADAIKRERIKAVAIIPLKYRGEIVGSLNYTSHTLDRIPLNIRNFLESTALQVVNYIAPVCIQAELS